MTVASAKPSLATDIDAVTRALRDIVWHFGPKGLSGECCANLSMPEFRALETIAGTADCPVQEVGRRLERKGCVVKRRSLADGRVCCLAITPRGRRILRTTDARYSAELEKLLARLPAASVSKVEDALKAVAAALRS
jgi:hypothetical protein